MSPRSDDDAAADGADAADGAGAARLGSEEQLRRLRRRLRSAVLAEPQRLDLREQLAAVYRAEGNSAQAGRWDFLSPTADPRETRAFTRAFGDDPVEIMRALRWAGSEDDAETQVARERLREVRAAARDRAGRRISWEKPVPDDPTWPLVLGCAGVLVVLGLAVVGAISTVRWLLDVV